MSEIENKGDLSTSARVYMGAFLAGTVSVRREAGSDVTTSARPVGLDAVCIAYLFFHSACVYEYLLAAASRVSGVHTSVPRANPCLPHLQKLNRLNVSLFTPSLLFSKVAFFLSPGT